VDAAKRVLDRRTFQRDQATTLHD